MAGANRMISGAVTRQIKPFLDMVNMEQVHLVRDYKLETVTCFQNHLISHDFKLVIGSLVIWKETIAIKKDDSKDI